MKKCMAFLLVLMMLTAAFGAHAEFTEDDFNADLFSDDVFETAGEDEGFEGADVFDVYAGGEPDEDPFNEETGEFEDIEVTDEFDLSFNDGGYTGEWVGIDELGVEFFLPTGWAQGEAAEDEYFFAENEDGTADLGVGVFTDDYAGDDLAAWAEENLADEEYLVGMANALEIVAVRDTEMSRVLVLVPLEDGKIVAFNFYRDSENVLSDAFALEIAGTCTTLWN